jgi:protein-L-isoaspartate(D-aspartate) O-methyltransferase
MPDTSDAAILEAAEARAQIIDFSDARTRMVDSQIRPNKVSDPRILASMRRLRRERFLPPALAARAYSDEDVPLGDGRVLTEPMVIARLVQLAAPMPGETALVVAAGSGYGAAVLADCGVHVFALEEDPALLALARSALAAEAPGVALVAGKLAAGWPDRAPYDLILIEGAVREIPPAIAMQLRPVTGRLVTVRRTETHIAQAVLAEAGAAGLRAQPAFDCATPLLTALLPAPRFVF